MQSLASFRMQKKKNIGKIEKVFMFALKQFTVQHLTWLTRKSSSFLLYDNRKFSLLQISDNLSLKVEEPSKCFKRTRKTT